MYLLIIEDGLIYKSKTILDNDKMEANENMLDIIDKEECIWT